MCSCVRGVTLSCQGDTLANSEKGLVAPGHSSLNWTTHTRTRTHTRLINPDHIHAYRNPHVNTDPRSHFSIWYPISAPANKPWSHVFWRPVKKGPDPRSSIKTHDTHTPVKDNLLSAPPFSIKVIQFNPTELLNKPLHGSDCPAPVWHCFNKSDLIQWGISWITIHMNNFILINVYEWI